LSQQVRLVWNESGQNYSARKVRIQLKRQAWDVARCTVERLMRSLGLKGIMRGKTVKKLGS
jgi:hypothetical protein